jgi:predicted methyltransferase
MSGMSTRPASGGAKGERSAAQGPAGGLDVRLVAAAGLLASLLMLAYAFWPAGEGDGDEAAARREAATPVLRAPPEVAEPAAAEAIRSGAREDQYIELDRGRHPREVLAFAGAGPGMTVLEWRGALGYYTELLSRAVGPRGKVYVTGIVNQSMVGRLGNVEVVAEDARELHDATVDLVFTHLNYHDLVVQKVDRVVLLGSAARVLKAGGALVVIDHAASPGSGVRDAVRLHRIDEQLVRAELETAGFRFDASSEVLRRPNDRHELFIMDPRVRGRTDRFVLRYVRPAGVAIPSSVPDPADLPETPEVVDTGVAPPPYDIGPAG